MINKKPRGYWTNDRLREEALKYDNYISFARGNLGAYKAAHRKGKVFFESICSHMPPRLNERWTDKELYDEAKKYKKRSHFEKGSYGAYLAACKRGKKFLDRACSHMDPPATEAYTKGELRSIAKLYTSVKDFKNSDWGAYQAARKRGPKFLEKACSHMDRLRRKSYTDKELYSIASSCESYAELYENNSGVYQAACKKGEEFVNKIRDHMPKPTAGTSKPEKELMEEVIGFFPDAKKHRITKLKIPGKEFIHWFEADIFIPHLMRAVEFDGIWYHSFKYMRAHKSKRFWSDRDIKNYDKIKDRAFLSRGITVLHIKEENWKNNQSECIAQIEEFLGITGFMSESESKVA